MYIIINPMARHGLAKNTSEAVLSALRSRGVQHEIRYTEKPGHAADIIGEIMSIGGEPPNICVIGGDGTLGEIVNGLINQDRAYKLGIIPAGTGNDLAKALGIPANPLEALSTVLDGQARFVDVGVANGRYFINVAGFGFDVAVLKHTLYFKRFATGIFPYILGILAALVKYRFNHISMTIDGQKIEQDVFLTSIANGNYIGGGMKCAPDAIMDDGLFDVIIVDRIAFWKVPFYLPKFINGSHIKLPFVHTHRCREAKVTLSGASYQLDGEILDGDELTFNILPKMLNVIAPPPLDIAVSSSSGALSG